MIASILVSIARQVEGEMIFFRVIKAHKDARVLNNFLRENNLPPTAKFGEVDCIIEYGIFENIEIEENE